VKGDCPPASGLYLERNRSGKRRAVFSPGKGEELGQGLGVRVRGALVRHKLLPDFIGPGQEEDLQRLADELGRVPLEQRGTNGLGGNDETGLVNHHGGRTPSKLGRGVGGELAGSRPRGVGLWFRQGQGGAAGTLVLA
jgi:hypothetical protein